MYVRVFLGPSLEYGWTAVLLAIAEARLYLTRASTRVQRETEHETLHLYPSLPVGLYTYVYGDPRKYVSVHRAIHVNIYVCIYIRVCVSVREGWRRRGMHRTWLGVLGLSTALYEYRE